MAAGLQEQAVTGRSQRLPWITALVVMHHGKR